MTDHLAPSPQMGRLIVFEGLRGSGKTTCLRAVAARLRELLPDTPILETREPTSDTAPGKLARQILVGEVPLADPRSFQLLAAADRLEHVATTIAPALARGEVVLCDRYVLSSAAHTPEGTSGTWVQYMNGCAPVADMTLVLAVPEDEALRRVLARDGRNDALAATATRAGRFYDRNSGLAAASAWSRRVVFLDGTAVREVVAEAALRHVLDMINHTAAGTP
jgi:dTMP kinase